MVLRKLAARFGKLDNSELKLESGLNVVYGENESGKSTWCAFIRIMLYGIKTSERDTASSLADKNRYLPWGGGAMEGRVELDIRGRRVVIERSSGKGGVMQNFSAYYADTGELLEGFNGTNAGDLLVGLSRDAFERSVFVGNSGLVVGSNDELERKIRSLASTGDEEISFAEANNLLGKWKRERKYNKTGLIPKAEEEYSEICRMLEESGGLSARREQAEQKLAALSEEAEILADSIATKRAGHAKGEIARIVGIRDQLGAVKALAEEKRRRLKVGEIELSRNYITSLRQSLSTIEDARSLSRDTEQVIKSARERETQARLEINLKHPHYEGRNPSDISAEAEKDYKEAAALSKKRARMWLFALAVLFAALAAAAAILSPGQVPWDYAPYRNIIIGASGGAALLCIIGGSISAVRVKKSRARVAELCRRHGSQNPEGIEAGAAAYAESSSRFLDAKNHTAEIESRLTTILEGIAAAEDLLSVQLKKTGWHDLNDRALNQSIQTYETLLNDCETSEREAELLGVRYEAMVSAVDMGTLSKLAGYEGRQDAYPDRTIDELQTRLNALDDLLEAQNSELTYIKTRQSMIGDRFSLEMKRDDLKKQIDRQTSEFNAITRAAYVLEAANSELTGRITPELNRRASTIFARFTGGKYLDVKIRKGFQALAGDGSAAAMRSILSLSSGTSDQLYLALRLAVSSMLFSTDVPPLILDDSFVTFDDRRLGSALEYLKEEAMLRQIVLFTCHDREINRLKDDPEVNIIAI